MKGLFLGIKHNPWRLFTFLFTSFSVLWTLIEGFTFFVPFLNLHGIRPFLAVVLISIIYSGIMVRRPFKIKIPVSHTNTRIEIKFGDIFKEDGYRAIPVNEFFDSEIGLPVSPTSLHGILISKCFGGHKQAFDQIIDEELKDLKYESVTRRVGKTKKYAIGTTAIVPVNNDKYLCFALSETELDTGKANADVLILWQALGGLWRKARISLGGSTLVLPLIGSGLSGIGLPTRELLNIIILSFITESKMRHITNCVRIILTLDRFEEVDLRDLSHYWR